MKTISRKAFALRPLRFAIVGIAASFALASCSNSASPTIPTVSSPAPMVSSGGDTGKPLKDIKLTADQLSSLAHDDDLFSGDLFQAVAKSNSGNLVISPASIAIALQMLTDGARGQTQQQLLTALHAGGLNSRELTAAAAQLLGEVKQLGDQVSMSNDIWLQQGQSTTAQFAADMRSGFDGAFRSVDFNNTTAAADTINQAISSQTQGQITNLIDPSSLEAAVAVITNAIYLHADWVNKFDPSMTHDASFTTSSGSTEQVSTMTQTTPFSYVAKDGYQAVTMPYQGNKLAMTIFLPAQGSSPAAVEALAAKEGFAALTSGSQSTTVDLSLPKFEQRTTTSLVSVLQSLGVTDAFGTDADLSGICQQCQVSSVNHEAWIKTDENGTTAAAATSIGISSSAVREESDTVMMNVDRPFLAVVSDTQNNLPLFVAQVASP